MVKSREPSWYWAMATVRALFAAAALCSEEGDLLAALDEAGEPVLDLALRLEHHVLVVDQQRLQFGVLGAHLIGDLAVVEHRPAERRAEGEGDARRGEELFDLVAIGGRDQRAERAAEREGRIEVGLGDADLARFAPPP